MRERVDDALATCARRHLRPKYIMLPQEMHTQFLREAEPWLEEPKVGWTSPRYQGTPVCIAKVGGAKILTTVQIDVEIR